MTKFVELNDKDLIEVEGDGLLGALAGGVIGLMVGIPVGMTAYTVGRFTGTASTNDFDSVMRDSMMASAGIGMTLGTFAPTP